LEEEDEEKETKEKESTKDDIDNTADENHVNTH
jgi:hypothetical protein